MSVLVLPSQYSELDCEENQYSELDCEENKLEIRLFDKQ